MYNKYTVNLKCNIFIAEIVFPRTQNFEISGKECLQTPLIFEALKSIER